MLGVFDLVFLVGGLVFSHFDRRLFGFELCRFHVKVLQYEPQKVPTECRLTRIDCSQAYDCHVLSWLPHAGFQEISRNLLPSGGRQSMTFQSVIKKK